MNTTAKNGWKTVPLIEVATLQRGFDLPVQNRIPGDIPVFAANGPVGTHNDPKVKGPGVVTGRSGTIGKVRYVDCDYWPLNTSLFVNDFHGNHPKFVFYLLSQLRLERFYEGTGVPTLNRNNIHGVEVPLPPLSEQKRIADILDKADAIRRKRLEAVSVHGTLGASAFLGFFGDPLTNPQGWKLETLETVSSKDGRGLKRGPFGGSLKKEIFVDQGFKVYEQKHAIADDFTIGSYYIDEDKFDEMEAFSVRPDDLIVSCSGTMGRVAIVPEFAEPGIINQALLRISPDTSKVSSLYLKMLLETTPVQRHLYGFSRGSGLKNFPPMSEVRALPVPIPSQERLAAFHQYMGQVTCAGEKIRSAEKAADDLFNSLVQSAFKGDL